MAGDDNFWGVRDTWQDRWCPCPRMSFIAALHQSGEYNKREAIGSKRYVAKRLPESADQKGDVPVENVKGYLQGIVDLADARLRDTSIDGNTRHDRREIIRSAGGAAEVVGVLLHHHVPADALTIRFGVWCVEDRTWCPALREPFVGTLAAAEVEVLHWRSGVRADVEPGSFHYEVREYKTETAR